MPWSAPATPSTPLRDRAADRGFNRIASPAENREEAAARAAARVGVFSSLILYRHNDYTKLGRTDSSSALEMRPFSFASIRYSVWIGVESGISYSNPAAFFRLPAISE